jgi:hypothetical protein
MLYNQTSSTALLSYSETLPQETTNCGERGDEVRFFAILDNSVLAVSGVIGFGCGACPEDDG